MVYYGKMHGFMRQVTSYFCPAGCRMYWAKKILEWTTGPEEALAIAIALNDKICSMLYQVQMAWNRLLWTIVLTLLHHHYFEDRADSQEYEVDHGMGHEGFDHLPYVGSGTGLMLM
ncbi:hypothetical protein ACH5RR_041104 [Cinchona calisaya]|uniref:Uncharacterized protein n=1 Tax=Cinchona calisaya TaxID=153742 RepID=A0ABD2XSZ3_9GENT